MTAPSTLYDKIWDDHVVANRDDGTSLIFIDRHLIHDRPDGRPSHADPACVPAGKTGKRFWRDPEGQWHHGQPVTPEDYAARQDARKTRIRNAQRRTA